MVNIEIVILSIALLFFTYITFIIYVHLIVFRLSKSC